MEQVAARLAHVLWIGGGPCAGKTTISRILAAKYDLGIYDLDRHYAIEPRFREGPAVRWWAAHTMDERWVDITADALYDRSVATWEDRFPIAVDELLRLPASRPLIVEGAGALPWLVAPYLFDRRQAVFLVPDMALRDSVVAKREARDASPVNYARTRDPDRARANHRERDRRLALRIEACCVERGLWWMRVDETTDLEELIAAVEDHLRPHLPAALNV